MKRIFSLIAAMALLGSFQAVSLVYAGELSYTPLNPSFGGSPFNGSNLLSGANAINKFTDPNAPSFGDQTLEERLDSLILSQVVSQLVSNAFDPSATTFSDGTFNTGVNTIVVTTSGGVTTILITNNVTGESTAVQVPQIVP